MPRANLLSSVPSEPIITTGHDVDGTLKPFLDSRYARNTALRRSRLRVDDRAGFKPIATIVDVDASDFAYISGRT